jgi:hypothetical protein
MIEVKVMHNSEVLVINCNTQDLFKTLREEVRAKLNFPNKPNSFSIYCGNYCVEEVFDELKIETVNGSFNNILRYEVQPYKDKYSILKDNPQVTVDSMKKQQKDCIDRYLSLQEIDDYMRHTQKDMDILMQNLRSMYQDACVQEENYRNGKKDMSLYKKKKEEYANSKANLKSKDDELQKCLKRIYTFKSLEKECLELVKINKHLMITKHNNERLITYIETEKENIYLKQNKLAKKRLNEAKFMKSYIQSDGKTTILGILFSFSF